MFNNVKAKKRLTQAIIAFVVICMTLTGSFLLLEDSIRTVSAETFNWNVANSGEWNTRFGQMQANSNNIYNITLTGDVSNTGQTGGKLTAVPAGVTVNLNMNNHNITWDYAQESGNFNGSLAADNYTAGTYYNGEYWGFVTNNGTLNITGKGVIRGKKIQITTQKQDHDNLAQRMATIVNGGTLTVGSQITVEAYLTYVHNSTTSYNASTAEDEASYSDAFMYNCGIYNTGTVTSSANISVGTMTGTSQNGSSSGYAYSFGYGIYGGNINVTGGNILVDSFAGGFMETGNSRSAHIYAAAVGVYGNNAMITGNTTINVLSKNWESQNQNSNTWQTGIDHLFSVGVLYTGASTPIIGPYVDVVASFEHIGETKTQIYVPGHEGLYWSGVYSDGGSDNTSHVAVPVGGVSKNINNIDYHNGEKKYDSDGGFFGNTSAVDSITRTDYRTPQSYFSDSNTTVNTTKMYNTDNSHVRYSSSIFNGVPGNTKNDGSVTSTDKGMPGDHSPAASDFKSTGSQYMVVYRYYKDVNNIDAVSFRYDNPDRVDSKAIMKVAGADNTNGILPNSSATLSYSSGANSSNEKYYEFVGRTYETLDSSKTDITSRIADINRNTGRANTPSLWAGSKGLFANDGTTVASDKDNTIIVYMDYQLKDPTAIRVVATNKDVEIDQYTTSTGFTVGYTGKALVPGEDFKLGIIDMGLDASVDTNDTNDDTVVTDVYNYNFKDSNKITVNYRHSADGINWNDGLPKDAGTYKIEVNVNADTTFAKTGTYNRMAATARIDCTINTANVTIKPVSGGTNAKSGTYGSTYAQLIPFSDFVAEGANGDTPSGSFSLSGVSDVNAYPNAGSYTYDLVWTPSSSDSINYGRTTYRINLTVEKRDVTVTVGAATATYGNSNFNSNDFLTYGNFPAVDVDKQAGWLANTTFKAENVDTGAVSDFHAGLPAGNYKLSIDQFGGTGDSNYTFSFTTGTLEVQQRPLYYTAEAAGKTYDGSTEVVVTLRFDSGNFGGDPYETIYNNVKGNMDSPNAGENKVTVVTDGLQINRNYKLVISNVADLKAKVNKANPTGVSVVADIEGNSIVYDKTNTLSKIGLIATENPDIPGTWRWADGNAIPEVKTESYTAVFEPRDTTNYNTCEWPVNIIVEKKPVEVTVKDPLTGESVIFVTYGDSVPALSGYIVYDGFTGGDTLAGIGYEGNTEVSTDYTPGSGRERTYTISVTTDIKSDNYSFTAKNGEIKVNKKAVTVTANDYSITYGDPRPVFDATDVTATGFYGSDSLNTINATVTVSTTYRQTADGGKVNADHKINVSVATDNQNYDIICVAGKLTVKKAVITITPILKTIPYGSAIPVYDVSDANDCKIDGLKYGQTIESIGISGEKEPTFETTYVVGSVANTYPVTVLVDGMISDNYTFAGASGSIIVSRANLDVQKTPNATLVNSHSLADAKFDDTAVVVNAHNSSMPVVKGTFTFVDSTFVPTWRTDGEYGSYPAIFTPEDDHNYNTITVMVPLNLIEKAISGIPVIQGSAMAGSTLTVSLASMDPSTASSYTYQWYADDTAISGATTATYEVKEADIGKTIYVVLDAVKANGFTGKATSAKTDAVIEALLETTAAQLKAMFSGVEYTELGVNTTFAGVEYDAMSHAATVTIADGYNAQYFGNITVKYNGSDKAPTAAGTYVVTVDVSTPAEPQGGYPENTYYGPATGIVVGTFTIARAPYTVTVLANDKVYDGNVTATATISGSGLKDELDIVNIAKESVRYTFADANVGTNKTINVSNVILTGEHAANYEVVVEPATANITPRTIYYRVANATKTYDGSKLVNVTFIYDNKNSEDPDVGYAAVDNASTVYPTNGTAVAVSPDAGTQILTNIDCILEGSKAGNYEKVIVNEGTATVTINQARPEFAPLVISHINGDKIEYQSQRTLASIKPDNYHSEKGSWKFVDESIVPTVKQQTYAAIYTPESGNYYPVTSEITVIVVPKEVTITAESKYITYGSNAPTYTTKESGFTGSDSLADIGGSLRVSSEYFPGADIDSYPITVDTRFLVSDNYTFVVGTPAYVTVSRRAINVTASAEDKVYDGNTNIKVNFAIDSGVYLNDDVELSSSSVTGTAATANAGTVAVSYTAPKLVGEKAKNYELNITPQTLTVVISKADVSGIVFPSNAQVEFGFDLSYATFGTPGVGDGTFAYENAKLIVPGDPGVYDRYKVIFTPTDSRNYNTQEAIVSLQVVKCTLNYVVGIAGTLQSGQTLSVSTTGLPAMANDFISYQWYRVKGDEYIAIKGATGRTYVATDDDIGYTLAVMTSFDSSAPYVFEDGITETIKGIEGILGESLEAIKEIKLTFWQRLMNWLYRIIAILTGIQLGGGLGIGG